MARGVIISDEYRWSASRDFSQWVIELILADFEGDGPAQELFHREIDNTQYIDLRHLPREAYVDVLRILAQFMVPRMRSKIEEDWPERERNSVRGEVKLLALMAADAIRSTDH